MATRTTDLFLLEDLEDNAKTSQLTDGAFAALEAVANWITSYVIKPHRDLGRSGPVCPFVPGSLERGTLWLAAEQIGDRSVADVLELMNGYVRRLLDAPASSAGDTKYRVIVVVFDDLPAERAQTIFTDVLEDLALPWYADEGVLFGPFYETNEGTALYNPAFRPFRSPVPFLFVRHTVVTDWKFFLDDPDLFDLWAERFGAAGAHSLAEALRPLPWRTHRPD